MWIRWKKEYLPSQKNVNQNKILINNCNKNHYEKYDNRKQKKQKCVQEQDV